MYRSLDPAKIIATIETLARRIGERFPHSGLDNVGRELLTVANHTSGQIARIARPNYLMRVIVAFVLASGLAALAALAWKARTMDATNQLSDFLQGVDSTFSILVFFGGSALYLSTLEGRWRQDRAMKALHELRSIVHVIDMHQLTKDPSALGAPRTSSSPDRSMTAHELLRYLGYCSELLSLSSKIAALYADKVRDPVIVEAVGDIERLTANLSQKIWQKIELVQERMPSRPITPAPPQKAIV